MPRYVPECGPALYQEAGAWAGFCGVHSFAGLGSQMISTMKTFLEVVPMTEIERGFPGDHVPSWRLE